MDAHGAGHLGDAHHRLFDVARRDHHQVVQLINHDDDVGQLLGPRGALGVRGQARRAFEGLGDEFARGRLGHEFPAGDHQLVARDVAGAALG